MGCTKHQLVEFSDKVLHPTCWSCSTGVEIWRVNEYKSLAQGTLHRATSGRSAQRMSTSLGRCLVCRSHWGYVMRDVASCSAQGVLKFTLKHQATLVSESEVPQCIDCQYHQVWMAPVGRFWKSLYPKAVWCLSLIRANIEHIVWKPSECSNKWAFLPLYCNLFVKMFVSFHGHISFLTQLVSKITGMRQSARTTESPLSCITPNLTFHTQPTMES